MTLSQKSGVTIIPLFARIVLGFAFITVGWAKLNHVTEYNPAQAQKLAELGVLLEAGPAPVQASSEDAADEQAESGDAQSSAAEVTANVALASFTQDDPAGQGGDEEEDAADDTQSGETIDTPTGLEPAEVYHGPSRWNVTLLLESQNFPEPVLMTYVATWTEFAGGILILLGFLSRIWGLGLAVTMGVAFYTTSMGVYFADFPSNMFRIAATDIGTYTKVFTQLGLFVLAFGVMLTGPGPISLDRLIMPRKSSGIEYDDDDEPSVQI